MQAPGNLSGVPGGLYGPGGLVADDMGLYPHWARITGNAAGTNRYSHEQIDDGNVPTFAATLASGFGCVGTSAVEGYPAYELSGRQDVPVGAIVKLWPAGDLTFLVFRYEAAALTSGYVESTGTYDMNSSSNPAANAWGTIGLTLPIPGAGLFEVYYNIMGYGNGTAPMFCHARFGGIAKTESVFVSAQMTGQYIYGSSHFKVRHTFAAAVNVQMEVMRTQNVGAANTIITQQTMGYLKVG